MAGAADSILGRIRHRRAVAGWQRLADRAGRIHPTRLALLRGRAIEMRRQIDRLVHAADVALEQPPAPADACLPPGTDWVWRPGPWLGRMALPGLASTGSGTPCGADVRLFHDCPHHEIGLRQRRNPGGDGLPPFAMDLSVFGFEGSFLSLVIDLPDAAVQGLGRHHLLRLDARVEAERPSGLFARLNLRHGPNVEQLVRHLPALQGGRVVEFDLADMKWSRKRIEALWLDLILETPAMNRIALRDLMLSRHPRAPL